MTPEQLSAAIDAWVWIDQQITTYGPGLALTAACIAVSWTCAKARAWRERRRDIRDRRAALLAEVEQMARHARAIEQAPLIPTQPGQDDDLLTACWDAWNTTDTGTDSRKEKP